MQQSCGGQNDLGAKTYTLTTVRDRYAQARIGWKTRKTGTIPKAVRLRVREHSAVEPGHIRYGLQGMDGEIEPRE